MANEELAAFKERVSEERRKSEKAREAELVAMRLAEPGCTATLPEILPAMRIGGVAAVSANGVLGDPTTATEVEGRRLWGRLVADVRRRCEAWRPGESDGMLR